MSGSPANAAPTAREAILARVREALREPAPLPHGVRIGEGSGSAGGTADAGRAAQDPSAAPSAGPLLAVLPADAARPWLPDGGGHLEERIAVLAENLERLRAGLERVGSLEAACDRIAALCLERRWRRVAGHPHPLVDPLLDRAAGLPECSVVRVGADPQRPFDKDALEACDLGITACEAIVSQTGSVLVSSVTGGGRSLSVLPHAHVVVATVDQVVATLDEALGQVRRRLHGRLPSMLSFITGPSRTGDIERILVLGAHGPRELVVILVG